MNSNETILNDRSISIVLWVLCAVSAYFTYDGILLMASVNQMGSGGQISALVFALGSLMALHLFWKSCITFSGQSTGKSTTRLLVLLIGIPFVIALSSWWNVVSLAGNAALDAQISKYVTEIERSVSSAQPGSQSRSLIADLDLEAAKYKRLAQSEFDSGTYSGKPGAGAVHTVLVQVSERLMELKRLNQKFVQEQQLVGSQIQGTLQELRRAVKKSDPEDRIIAISEKRDELIALMGKVNPDSMAISLGRAAKELPREAEFIMALSPDPLTANRQNLAINQLQIELTHTGTELSKLASSLDSSEALAFPTFERTNPMLAVVIYAKYFIPLWMGGLALDLVFLVPFIFQIASRREDLPDENAALESLTVKDVYLANRAKTLMRLGGSAPILVEGDEDKGRT